MKFSIDSAKLKAKGRNEDFSFELQTPRGHFFALLAFAEHDYANLNATLKSKTETIVGSFVSLSRFSAELFLGFMAKEINNFLHKLGEQSGGPELLASGALCLVSGNRLSYFLCGDVQLNIVNNGRLLPLFGPGAEAGAAASTSSGIERFGANNREAQLNEAVQSFTLQDGDLALVTTQGFQPALSGRQLVDEISNLGSTDPKVISDALMKSAAVGQEDRSLIVISGPYEKYVDPVLTDLSKAIAALEAKMEALTDSEKGKASSQVQSDQRFVQQIQVLRDDLKGKAAKIDLLELDGKLKSLTETLAQKASTTEVAALQRQFGNRESVGASSPSLADHGEVKAADAHTGVPSATVLALVLATAVIGSLIGGWVYSMSDRKGAEAWVVKSDGGQVTISRLDGEPTSVTLNAAVPATASGEQRFSSFADAKRYIDTLTSVPATANSPVTTPTASATDAPADTNVTETTVKEGDTLKKLAAQYNVPPEKLMSLNPTIKRWPAIRVGQKIIVPARAPAPGVSPVSSADQPANSTASPNTTEVTLLPGDSLNRLAARYKATPDRIRELNPQITNWATILAGQRVVVPAQPGA